MKNIETRIKLIEDLLEKGSLNSLTYAALECRFTIELICYERLMVAYGYTSYSDLRRWQPKDVVHQVVQEANDLAAATFTLSISKTPVEPGNTPMSESDFEEFEYVDIGMQKGFDIKNIGRLWNSLSNVALHVQIPKNRSDDLSVYGKLATIKTKVEDALKLFRELAKGNLLASSPGPEVTYLCDGCGEIIKRKSNLVYNGMVASCSSESCHESYVLTSSESGVDFGRRLLPLICNACSSTIVIPSRRIDGLRNDQSLAVECGSCNHRTLIRLRPCIDIINKEP